MRSISDIIKRKGNRVISAAPDDTVYSALELMADEDIGALLILKEGRIEGIFSERDYARKVILKGLSSKELKVKDIMSTKVFYVSPAQSIEECMALMNENKIRHLPVVEEKKILGMISIGDVVKSVIEGKDMEIKELNRYITGGR